MLVWCVVESGGGYLGGKPIGLGQADSKWDEVLLDLLLGELVTDFVQRFHGLQKISKGTYELAFASRILCP